jgi:hypothetical protein
MSSISFLRGLCWHLPIRILCTSMKDPKFVCAAVVMGCTYRFAGLVMSEPYDRLSCGFRTFVRLQMSPMLSPRGFFLQVLITRVDEGPNDATVNFLHSWGLYTHKSGFDRGPGTSAGWSALVVMAPAMYLRLSLLLRQTQPQPCWPSALRCHRVMASRYSVRILQQAFLFLVQFFALTALPQCISLSACLSQEEWFCLWAMGVHHQTEQLKT